MFTFKLKISHFWMFFAFGFLLPLTIFSQSNEGWKWRFDAKSTIYSTPFAGANNFYVYNADGFVFALDTKTGREKWRFKLRPETYLDESGEASGRLVLLERFETTSNSKPVADNVVGLDQKTGKEVWRRDFGGSYIREMSVSGDLNYLNVENIGTAVLDAAGGDIKWQSDACPDVIGAPNLDGKNLYVECFGGKIYALDADGGNLLWKFGSRGQLSSRFVFSGDAVFYNHSEDYNRTANLFALDKKSGRKLWEIAGSESYPDQVLADNLFVTSTIKGAAISAVDAATGKTVWQIADAQLPAIKKTPDETEKSLNLLQPTFSGGVLYFGSYDGNLLAVESKTGKILWNNKISEERVISPEIIGTKAYTFIVQNETYYLAAIELSDGKINWRMRLYGAAYSLSESGGVLFFESDDNFINAVNVRDAEKLARAGKTLGSLTSVKQIVNSHSGSGSGVGIRRNTVQDDVQAESSGGKAFLTVSRKTGSRFYEIDLATGAKKLLVEHGIEQLTEPQISSSGTAYYLGSDFKNKHTLYAFDTVSGKMRWQADSTGNATSPPVVSGEYVAYSSNDGVLSVYDLGGKLVLNDKIGLINTYFRSTSSIQPVIVEGDALYFNDGKSLRAYDLANAKPKWRTDLPQFGGNVAVGKNTIFFGSNDENLYAVDKQTGAEKWKVNVSGTPSDYQNSVYFDAAIVYYVSRSAAYKYLLQAFDAADGKLIWERNVGDSEIQFGGDYVFTDNVGKVFDKKTGKSVFYDNLLEVRKFSLVEVSDNRVLLSQSGDKLKIAAVDWQNRNKVLWKIDFTNLDLKSNFNPKTTAD